MRMKQPSAAGLPRMYASIFVSCIGAVNSRNSRIAREAGKLLHHCPTSDEFKSSTLGTPRPGSRRCQPLVHWEGRCDLANF